MASTDITYSHHLSSILASDRERLLADMVWRAESVKRAYQEAQDGLRRNPGGDAYAAVKSAFRELQTVVHFGSILLAESEEELHAQLIAFRLRGEHGDLAFSALSSDEFFYLSIMHRLYATRFKESKRRIDGELREHCWELLARRCDD